jgi:hypothetical protein
MRAVGVSSAVSKRLPTSVAAPKKVKHRRPVTLSADFMSFSLTTLYESGLLQAKSFVFIESFRYFHGSEGSLQLFSP